ncbi:MAG TPA: hypothetical protein VJ826_12515 [Candidatus Polarisedimenticolaceae bacterium]|nr:hypothetical protein [Candidatus Polarisedimenticolaceae bacterium]
MRRFSVAVLLLASPCIAEVTLKNAGSTVALSEAQKSQLAQRLNAYVGTCHPYRQVVGGDERPQEELTKAWSETEKSVHALLGDDRRLVLFGFPTANGGLGAVLARNPDGSITSYAKCPGHEGLALACHVHRLVPGVEPNPRCPEFETLRGGP